MSDDSKKKSKTTAVPEEEPAGGSKTGGTEVEPVAATSEGEQQTSATLQQQLEQSLAERAAHLDGRQRAEAELDNFRKRMHREVEEQRKYQSLLLARDITPVLDNLRRAIEAAKKTEDLQQLVKGVEMVAQQIEDTLVKHQVMPISAEEGQPFDSNLHEAVQQVASAEHPPLTVIDEVERGYTLHDRLVRPSKVIVSKAADESEIKPGAEETEQTAPQTGQSNT